MPLLCKYSYPRPALTGIAIQRGKLLHFSPERLACKESDTVISSSRRGTRKEKPITADLDSPHLYPIRVTAPHLPPAFTFKGIVVSSVLIGRGVRLRRPKSAVHQRCHPQL